MIPSAQVLTSGTAAMTQTLGSCPNCPNLNWLPKLDVPPKGNILARAALLATVTSLCQLCRATKPKYSVSELRAKQRLLLNSRSQSARVVWFVRQSQTPVGQAAKCSAIGAWRR